MEIEWSLTCQREDGFDGPKLTCPPLPPQQYAHRNQDSSFVSRSPSLSLSLYPQQPIIHDRRCPIRRGDGSRSRANRDIPFSSIVTRTMSPLYSLSTRRNFAWLTTNGATERAEFPSPEFPRRIDRSHRPIDRSDPTRSDPIREIPWDIGAALSARGSSTARVIAIAIAVPDCDSFYREPIDRIANIDRIARSLPRVFPTFTRAPTISQLCPRLRRLPFGQTWRGRRKIRFDESCRRASIIGSSIHGFLLLDLVR